MYFPQKRQLALSMIYCYYNMVTFVIDESEQMKQLSKCIVSINNSVPTYKVITLTVQLPALPARICPTTAQKYAHSDKSLAASYLTCHGISRNSPCKQLASQLKRHFNYNEELIIVEELEYYHLVLCIIISNCVMSQLCTYKYNIHTTQHK